MDRLRVKNENGGSLEDANKLSIFPGKCNTCQKLYATKSSFSHHKATCKKSESKDAISYPRVCPTCHVSYSDKCNYSRYKKNCNESLQYIKCPHDGCGIKFQSHSVMISHLQSSHQEDICVEEYEFKDLNEFNAWKSNQCELNNMSLVKHNVWPEIECSRRRIKKGLLPETWHGHMGLGASSAEAEIVYFI